MSPNRDATIELNTPPQQEGSDGPTASLQRPQRAPAAADLNRGASMVQRLVAAADWSNRPPVRCWRSGRDRPQPAPYRTATQVMALEPGPGCAYEPTKPPKQPWCP
jgi:hypothetical protein